MLNVSQFFFFDVFMVQNKKKWFSLVDESEKILWWRLFLDENFSLFIQKKINNELKLHRIDAYFSMLWALKNQSQIFLFLIEKLQRYFSNENDKKIVDIRLNYLLKVTLFTFDNFFAEIFSFEGNIVIFSRRLSPVKNCIVRCWLL